MQSHGATHWLFAAALTVVTVAPDPVEAFYWYVPPEKTIVPPPPNPPPPPPPPIVVPPTPTPEPGTVFGALIGLGTLAARRAMQKRQG
ncbi:MAG: hypothetical protein C0467_02610 [Planctomycetaceae bacterium]|nr:hypothetical protein [Planctomycetaceae bacterium]